MLGDGVHFHFADSACAVLGSLDFVDKAEGRGAVIVARRIASQAGPGQVLVGEDAANAKPPGVALRGGRPDPAERRRAPVTLFRAVRDA
jgi:hypothetical protein